MTAPLTTLTRHFQVLDGLRGVAAVAVVAHHFGSRSELPGLVPRGYLAVDFFFVLSGFVLAHAYLGQLQKTLSTTEFLLKRWIRLWPMLLPGTLFGAIMEIWRPTLANPGVHSVQVVVALILGIAAIPLPWQTSMEQMIFPINGPVWSLCANDSCDNLSL